MKHRCPRCSFGHLHTTRSSYVRRMGRRLVTVPGFQLWRCDFCGYARYDAISLARLETLLGPDAAEWDTSTFPPAPRTEGPAERGPRRWSS